MLVLAARFRAAPNGLPLSLVCVAVIAAAILARPTIVGAAPQVAALYAKIGLPVNLRGLVLKQVKSGLDMAGADPLLVVEGEIVNVTRQDLAVPRLELFVRGADGHALYTWTNEAPRKTLAPGETAAFRARLASPPAEGRQVLVRFASEPRDLAVAEAH